MNKLVGLAMVLSVLSVVIISGCTTPTGGGTTTIGGGSGATCGNSVVEQGEQCDKTDCGAGKYCSVGCQCINKPSPPTLPQ